MIEVRVRAGRWADSAKMMAAARAAEAVDGVERAFCFMGTPANREEAAGLGMHDPAIDGAGPDDLVIAVQGDGADAGVAAAEDVLDKAPAGAGGGGPAVRAPRSLARAEGDVAVVSVPGEYAALEAHKALGAGMDVLLFSDNVAIEDEVALKRRAHERGLLVMGPGAGRPSSTAWRSGSRTSSRRGRVGVVAAAGTGAQEVTVLLDRAGAGVQRLLRHRRARPEGRGRRDHRPRRDRPAGGGPGDTDVILCVSKPPSPTWPRPSCARWPAAGKPAAACMVGGGVDPVDGVHLADTLEEAALAAARLAGHDAQAPRDPRPGWVVRRRGARAVLGRHAVQRGGGDPGRAPRHRPLQRARRAGPPAARASPVGPRVLDLGEEEFTRGRPHPMIDPAARAERLARRPPTPTWA